MVRTVAEKLQIKPDSELMFGPSTAEQRALLDPLPDGVAVVDGIERDTSGVAVLFAGSRDELDALRCSAAALDAEGDLDRLPQGKSSRYQPRQHLEACRGVRMDAQRQHLAV